MFVQCRYRCNWLGTVDLVKKIKLCVKLVERPFKIIIYTTVFETFLPCTPISISLLISIYRKRQQWPNWVWVAPKCWSFWDGRQLSEPKGARYEGSERSPRLGTSQSSGQKRGWEQQRQEKTQSHHIHQLPARRARESFPEDTLPRCLCPWAAGTKDGPDRGTCAGEVKEQHQVTHKKILVCIDISQQVL